MGPGRGIFSSNGRHIMQITDKVVLISGASSGIGAATAVALARDGAKVVLLARRGERLQAVAQSIEASGGVSLVAVADVTEPTQVHAAVAESITTFGRLDVVITSSGVGAFGAVESIEASALEAMVRTNVIGTLNVIQAALPHLKQSRGMIVTITSFLGVYPLPYLGALGSTKAMINALSTAMRTELKPWGIKVLNFGPPETESEFHNDSGTSHRKRAKAGDVADKLVRAIRAEKREVIAGRFFKIMGFFAPKRLDALFSKAMVAT